MKNITTIKIEKQTKLRLDHLKEHKKETYEEIIKKMLYILNTLKKKPELAHKILRNVDRIIKRKQRYTSGEQSNPKKPKQDSNPKQNPQQDKDSH